MNLETGVIRFSSPSMGACARAGVPASASAHSTAIKARVGPRRRSIASCVPPVGFDPSARPLHRAPPARVARLARRGRMAGVNLRSSCPAAAEVAGSSRAPRPARPGRRRRAPWSRSPTGAAPRTPSTSAWNWQRKSLAAAPPSTRSAVSGTPASAAHGVQHVAGLVGDGLERGARQVRARGAAREADDRAARVRVPVGRAEARRRRARSRRRRCPAPTRPAPRVSAALA